MKKLFKLLTTKTIIIILALITIGAPIIYLTVLNQKEAKASWMDENWLYRKSIAITNAGSNQTDFQVSFTLDTATLITNGKMLSSCNDIRVTDINGKLLPYWIEEGSAPCNNASTKVWVKVPSITTSGATVYVYYGNPSAPSVADGAKVFEFFDDFNNSTLNTTKWNSTGSPTITSNALTLSSSAGIVSQATQSTNDGAKQLVFRAKTASATVNTARLGYSNTNTLATTYYNDDSAHMVLGPEQTYLSGVAGANELGMWRFADLAGDLSNGSDTTDSSSNNNPLTSVAGATRATGVYDYGATFNGSTQYLKQKAYLTGTATVVTTAGSATANITGLATYATASQPYSYMIASTNCTTVGWGYLGAVSSGDTVKVFSTKTGSTQNWTTVGSGGTCDTYEVRKTDFQIFNGMSLGAWVKRTATGRAIFLSKAENSTGDYFYGLEFIAADKPTFRYNYTDIASNTAITDSNWHFIVGVRNGTNLSLYVDGALVKEGTNLYGSIDNATDSSYGGCPLAVGLRFNCITGTISNKLTGTIDSPFVLSSSLTAAQVQALYNASGANYGVLTNNAITNTFGESTTAIDADTYHTFAITQLASSSTISVDGGTAVTNSTNSPNSTQYIRFENSDASNAVSVDWAFVRKTASTEPSVGSPGTEEAGPGPVAYWSFDDGQGTTAQDSSSSQNTGTLGGTTIPTWQTEDVCISGKCLYFDGATSKVTGSKIAYGIQTVSFWIKPNTIATQGLVDLDGGTHKISTNGSGVISATGFSSPAYYINGVLKTTPTLTLNQWNHVSITTATGFNSTATFTIGTDGTNFIKGFIDDVKIYPYARTAAQIKTDFVSRSSRIGQSVQIGPQNQWISQGLVGYWKMDESSWSGTSADVLDASGNGNNGTAACSGGGCTKPTGAAVGKFGNGGGFNGSNQFVDASLNTSGFSEITMTAWTKPTNDTDANGSVTNYSGSKGFFLRASGRADGKPDGGSYYNTSGCPTVVANQWVFAAVTFKNGVMTSYQNGVPCTTPVTGLGSFQADTTIRISNYYTGGTYGGSFPGTIDEVRIYNRALSPKEVSDLYNFAPGPVGYWNFEEGSGTTTNDTSGNGYNGTITGATYQTGKYGKALNFNGSTDAVGSISSISGINTVSFWVNPTSTTANLIDLQTTPGTINISASSGTISATGFTSPTYYINGVQTAAPTLTANTWQYITVTSATAVTGSALRFGRISTTSLTGKLDDVKIYNYARTGKQIVADMSSRGGSTSGGNGGALGYWKFDEGQGTTANNTGSQGSALNGTISNGTWSQSGKFGKALTFASNTSVTTTITDPAYSNTISLWINPTTSVASKTLVTATKLTTDSSSRPVYGGCTGSALSLSTWTHIVAVSDGSGVCKIYQNGVQTASSTTGVTFGTSINIGASSYTGTLDEVKIYNYALTSDEVKVDYNRGSSMVLGAAGTNSTYQGGAANQEYCVPGDTTSCVAPVLQWKFEEKSGNTVNDTSGNGYSGTWGGTGSPHWVSGKVGTAANFNGSDDYIDTTGPASNASTTAYTAELWFKRNGGADTLQYLFSDTNAAHNDFNFNISVNSSNQICIHIYNITNRTICSTTTVTNGTWYHVAAVQNSPGSARQLYVNGILENSDSQTSGNFAYTHYHLGVSGTLGNYFNGQIDSVRLFNYARSAAQVAYDYNRGAPVGHWKMDECQGTTAYDSSGNGYSGTITIGASGEDTVGTCTTSSTAWGSGVTGKRNASLSFDGTDDYVNMGTSAGDFLEGNQYSASLWFKTSTSLGNLDGIISQSASSPYRFAIRYNTTSSVLQFMANGNSLNTTLNPTTGTWYHIVATFDNVNGRKFYVNGVLNASDSYTTVAAATADPLYIGLDYIPGQGREFPGQIDDVKVFNYALTPLQIKNLYNDGAVNFGPVTGAP